MSQSPPKFPSELRPTVDAQLGLFATANLAIGTAVARFEGPILPWREVPAAEVRHAILLQADDWMIPTSSARFINHSCAPNCTIDDSLAVVTTRPVAAGEELTFSYDSLSLADWLRGPKENFWDDRWSFDCRCGAPHCVGRVDRYRVRHYDSTPPVAPASKLRLGAVPGKGRGVFATAAIASGEIIERAPVLISPDKEWPDVEKTVLYHYCFAWGPQLQHTAIGLGYASLYNHSYTPNAVYIRQLDDLLIHFVARRDIAAGEEVTINYNNDPANQEPVWFDVR